MTKRTKPAGSAKPESMDLGFAAFVDLRDSTYLWNQNPDLAEETVAQLAATVQSEIAIWQGRVGNFTGDGFLLLFTMAEYAVRALANLVEKWEPQRAHYCDLLGRRGAAPPDEFSLMLRTGIAHGHYRMFRINGRPDYAGEAINRASRCESSSKQYFEQSLLHQTLGASQRIFITHDVFNLIRNKTDYWYSEKLPVEFKGYERPSSTGLTASPDYIVAIWPKAMTDVAYVAPLPYRHLSAASARASKIDAADRLVAAARSLENREPPALLPAKPKRPPRDVLLGAIMSYREALEHLPETGAQEARAEIHGKLALAHAALAEYVPAAEQGSRLDEAAREMQSALRELSASTSPQEFALASSNLAGIRRRQAELSNGSERAKHLTSAITSLEQAAAVYTGSAAHVQRASALSALATVLLMQADDVPFERRHEHLSGAVAALREALHASTPAAAPEAYASTQNDLATALRMQAEVTNGEDRTALLAESEVLAREAIKALTLELSPARYANAQCALGDTLLTQSEMLPHIDKAERLAESAAAFREALKAHTADVFPLKFASTNMKLGKVLCAQAQLADGSERQARLDQARSFYTGALSVYTKAAHPDKHDAAKAALEELKA